jgi:hypothetical protein
MRGLPFELLLILFLGAVVLYTFLRQRAQGLRLPEPAQGQPETEDIPEAVWRRDAPERATRTDTAPPVRAQPRTWAAADTAPQGAQGGRRRRFDRQALLGTRQRVQDAFVVATILGRCRADEPHEVR